MTGLARRFFAAGRSLEGDDTDRWTALRDRWEHSHIAPATLAAVSTLAMLIALQQCVGERRRRRHEHGPVGASEGAATVEA